MAVGLNNIVGGSRKNLVDPSSCAMLKKTCATPKKISCAFFYSKNKKITLIPAAIPKG